MPAVAPCALCDGDIGAVERASVAHRVVAVAAHISGLAAVLGSEPAPLLIALAKSGSIFAAWDAGRSG